jgi:hypothetical protein
MAPLNRAIALEQINRVALRIAEHLDFDVPRRDEIFFDEDAVIAECRLRLSPR